MAATASKGKQAKFDYAATVRALRDEGPQRLYLLYGEEDYLREQFFEEIKKLTVDPGTADFNHKRIPDLAVGMDDLREAVTALPFFAERTLIEVREFDPGKLKERDLDALKQLVQDIPDYCTLVLIPPTGKDPDGRLAIVKAIRKQGCAIAFTAQGESMLCNWIRRRFQAMDKTISKTTAEYLIFVSGSLMNQLITEIEKVAGFAKGEEVTVQDIDAVVTRLPESNIFEMTERMAKRDFNGAAAIAADLLRNKEHPIMLTAMVGQQFRRLYAARLSMDESLGTDYVRDVCGIKHDFILKRLMGAAQGFTLQQLERAVALCAETDFAMKSAGGDSEERFKDLLLRLAMEAA